MRNRTKAIIGVDWGTSRTYPAIVDEEGVCQSLIPSGNRNCSGGIPSLFAYNRNDGIILCDDVVTEELEIYDPQSVVSSIKMHLNNFYKIDDKEFIGTEIATKIIETQMQYAISELEVQDLQADTTNVVVCAPVSFGTVERSNIRGAFKNAGYNVVRIIAEPVAAAIYYGRKGTVLVLDIGAGTADVALVKDNPLITTQNPYPYLYIDSSGVEIAGDMFDESIADYLAEKFVKEVKGIDARQLKDKQSSAYRRLKVAARKAKEGLSNKMEIGVTYNGREAGSGRVRMTRQEMNYAIHPLVKKITDCVVELLHRNRNVFGNNLEVIMTGGSSYIPYIKEQLARTCEQISEDRIYIKSPEKAIGFGAAIFAADMQVIRTHVDFSYGVNTYIDDVEVIQTLIPAGVQLPYSVERDYYTRYEDQTKVGFDLYEYRVREDTIPIDENKQMKECRAIHDFGRAVPRGTKCTAKMTLTEDGILKLEVRSEHSDHVGATKCSVFVASDSAK